MQVFVATITAIRRQTPIGTAIVPKLGPFFLFFLQAVVGDRA